MEEACLRKKMLFRPCGIGLMTGRGKITLAILKKNCRPVARPNSGPAGGQKMRKRCWAICLTDRHHWAIMGRGGSSIRTTTDCPGMIRDVYGS